MQKMDRYNWAQIALHWGIAGLILANYLFSEGIEDGFEGMMEAKVGDAVQTPWHIYVGLAVLVLVAARVALRLLRPVAIQTTARPAMDRMAEWGHLGLYALMIAAPVLGAITWYGRVENTGDLHILAVNGLIILAFAHSIIALFHQFVLKDGLLMRMLRT